MLPLISKAGCNAAACHGSAEGRGGGRAVADQYGNDLGADGAGLPEGAGAAEQQALAGG